jgi:hypothetical protein
VEVAPTLLPYFDSSLQKSLYPGIWTATTFSLESYRLPTNTADIIELRELSQQEYGFFPRQFKGEIIHHAPPINFMGRPWTFMVSSVHEKLYKWAESLEVSIDEDFETIGNEVVEYCIRWLGATTEEKQGYLFWDTIDGNVILQLASVNALHDISILVPSREIRKLDKL